MNSGAEPSGMVVTPCATAGRRAQPIRSMNSRPGPVSLASSAGPASRPSSTRSMVHHSAATPRPCASVVPATAGWESFTATTLGSVTIARSGAQASVLRALTRRGGAVMNLRALVFSRR